MLAPRILAVHPVPQVFLLSSRARSELRRRKRQGLLLHTLYAASWWYSEFGRYSCTRSDGPRFIFLDLFYCRLLSRFRAGSLKYPAVGVRAGEYFRTQRLSSFLDSHRLNVLRNGYYKRSCCDVDCRQFSSSWVRYQQSVSGCLCSC